MSDLTIRDIAKIAGVSTTAVSFVLNNRPGVSDATRQHVQEVIARTGFTPNVHTRRLNLGRSFSIHVVLYWHEHDLFSLRWRSCTAYFSRASSWATAWCSPSWKKIWTARN